MSIESRLAALEERLAPIRKEVDEAFAELDKRERNGRDAVRMIEIYASKTRHVILEALSEIRHIDNEIQRIREESSTTASPGTRRAKGRSRSRADRD